MTSFSSWSSEKVSLPLLVEALHADTKAILHGFPTSKLGDNLADDSVAEIAPRPGGGGWPDEGHGKHETNEVTERIRVSQSSNLPTCARSLQRGGGL